jgi:hypothetical protein
MQQREVLFFEDIAMKVSAIKLSAAILAMMLASGAYAVECRDGVRRAECETSRGAVEVRKPVEPVPARGVEMAPAREAPAAREAEMRVTPECRMVDGRRVCR